MTRDDVVDVLTAVAAGDRRTVGKADVEFWSEIIGDLPKDLAMRAVRDHFRERPGVWLDPGFVFQRVRAITRDALEREPDSMREARQAALAVKVADQVEELAGRRGVSAAQGVAVRPSLNPLCVRCPWCRAGVGQHCVVPGTRLQLRSGPHPSRRDLVKGVSA